MNFQNFKIKNMNDFAHSQGYGELEAESLKLLH